MEIHRPRYRKNTSHGRRDSRSSGFGGPRNDRSSGYRGPRDDRSSGYRGPRNDRSSGYRGPRDDRSSGYGRPRDDRGSRYRGPRNDRSSGFGGPRNDRSSGFGGPRNDRSSGFGGPRNDRSSGYRRPRDDRGSGYGRPRDDRGSGYRGPRNDRSSGYNQGQSRFQRDRTPIHSRDNFEPKRFQTNRDDSYQKNSRDNNSFYSTLRTKLFAVLGEKKCVNCGFDDERALGFGQTDDVTSFDYIQRAGIASSWEKYISDPDLAKKKLQIICLNCNMIKQKEID